MNKKLVLVLLLFAFFLPSAMATASANIGLEIVEGELVATSVYDDDSSIERVDVFVSDPYNTRQYSFNGVGEGQVLDITFGPASTVSYNFTDTDGAIIGLGILIIVQTGSVNPPECIGTECQTEPTPNVFQYFDMKPRMAPGNTAYYVDFEAKLTGEVDVSTVTFQYGFPVPVIQTIEGIQKDSTTYTATIGPFAQELRIMANTTVTTRGGGEYSRIKGERFIIYLPDETDCTIGQVITIAPEPGIIEEQTPAFFASLDGFSYLAIYKDEAGVLRAVQVKDDDSSIERVDIFYRIGENVSQTTYYNVTKGKLLGLIPTEAEFAWFNYYDFGGSMSNISVLNQFLDEEPVIIIHPPPESTPEYFSGNLIFYSELSESKKSFTLKVKIGKGTTVPESIYYRYAIDHGTWKPTIPLEDQGETYGTTIGTLDSKFTINGFITAEGPDGRLMTSHTETWIALIPSEQVECIELCFDGIDNDQDGLVDEDCVMLSELFFLKKNVPYYSLSNKPIRGDLIIKNSGVTNASSSTMNIYLDNELVANVPVQSIEIGDTEQAFFEIPYKEEYEGEHRILVVLDAKNVVSEMIESNNSYEQDIIIGPDFFDVALNYNDTHFPADYRQIHIKDSNERNVQGATVKISTPSSQNIVLNTDQDGLIEFQLPKSGTYSVNVTKEEYIPFEGKFAISPLILVGLKEVIPAGESQELSIENEENRKLEDGLLQVSLPQGLTKEYDLSLAPLVAFTAEQQGKYALRVIRNDLVIYESDFLATGIVESILLGPGNLLDLLFGSIIKTPLLFLFLILLALSSAYFAYLKSPMFFRKGAKGSSEKKVERAIRIGISIMYFVLPFQFDKMFGFNAALLAIFLEVVLLLVYDYYSKQIRGARKAIKV